MGGRGAVLFQENFIAAHRGAICNRLQASLSNTILDPGFSKESFASIRNAHHFFSQIAKIKYEEFT